MSLAYSLTTSFEGIYGSGGRLLGFDAEYESPVALSMCSMRVYT